MGLAQRRILAEYQEKNFPGWKKKLDSAAGTDVPLDVKWDTMTEEDRTDKDFCFECWEKVYFKPLLMMISDICADKMGKDAFKTSVKKIVVDGSDGWGYHNATFENGVLTILHKPFTNVDNEKERADGWRKLVESKL